MIFAARSTNMKQVSALMRAGWHENINDVTSDDDNDVNLRDKSLHLLTAHVVDIRRLLLLRCYHRHLSQTFSQGISTVGSDVVTEGKKGQLSPSRKLQPVQNTKLWASSPVNVKSFSSHKGHKAAVISVSTAFSYTCSLHCETTDTGLVHRALCLFVSYCFRQYSLRCTHGGIARLSWSRVFRFSTCINSAIGLLFSPNYWVLRTLCIVRRCACSVCTVYRR